MPPLPQVAVPVINLSEQTDHKYTGKGKHASKPLPGGRTYKDGPLPVKPSELAPRKARIVERTDYDGVPTYQLKIGDTEIDNVGLDEILDYVSALDLEIFENKKFLEEREVLKIVAAEEQREAEEERQREKQRRKFKAKTKGTVFYESFDEAESGLSTPAEGMQTVTGRNGRPRPTYKHLYKLPKERRRRKRDPETGELMPFSDDEQGVESSSDDMALIQPPGHSEAPQDLLALPNKRPRRRRHHITKELMPLGWRYDPNEEEGSSAGQPVTGDETSILRDLTISEEPSAKRQRLDLHSVSPSSTQQRRQALLDRSSLASAHSQQQSGIGISSRPQSIQDEDMMMADSSSEPVAPTSITRPSAAVGKTSITNPSATNNPVPQTASDELSEDDEDEDEYDIESILAHSMSNPITHPPGLGHKPVMLYQVKWQGFDEPTWEPLESFGDVEIVNDYHRNNGLKPPQPNLSDSTGHDEVIPKSKATLLSSTKAAESGRIAVKQRQPRTSMTNPSFIPDETVEESESDLDEDEYEVEQILSHRLSDPRSHPPELGKNPIMLYQVKWKGYHEMTWEPADSFDSDPQIIAAYRKRAGLGV